MSRKNTSIDLHQKPEEISQNHGMPNIFINALLKFQIFGRVRLLVVSVTQNKGENLNIGTFPQKY
jgi:hypothetical protein